MKTKLDISSYPFSCALRAETSYNYLPVNGERRLTPGEMLRLQSFHDLFKFVVSDYQTGKQAGNAVLVNIIRAEPDLFLPVMPGRYAICQSTSRNPVQPAERLLTPFCYVQAQTLVCWKPAVVRLKCGGRMPDRICLALDDTQPAQWFAASTPLFYGLITYRPEENVLALSHARGRTCWLIGEINGASRLLNKNMYVKNQIKFEKSVLVNRDLIFTLSLFYPVGFRSKAEMLFF